jgi:hypothetical protein
MARPRDRASLLGTKLRKLVSHDQRGADVKGADAASAGVQHHGDTGHGHL